eukprot:4312854-Karenia_brevis.AAC.1
MVMMMMEIIFPLRVLLQFLSLDPARQAVIAAQGHLLKPHVFADATAVLIGRIRAAKAAHLESIAKLLKLDRSVGALLRRMQEYQWFALVADTADAGSLLKTTSLAPISKLTLEPMQE